MENLNLLKQAYGKVLNCLQHYSSFFESLSSLNKPDRYYIIKRYGNQQNNNNKKRITTIKTASSFIKYRDCFLGRRLNYLANRLFSSYYYLMHKIIYYNIYIYYYYYYIHYIIATNKLDAAATKYATSYIKVRQAWTQHECACRYDFNNYTKQHAHENNNEVNI